MKIAQAFKKGYDLVIGIRNYVPRISEKIFNIYTSKKFDISDILCGLKGYNLKTINTEVLGKDYNACPNIALDYIKNKKKSEKYILKLRKEVENPNLEILFRKHKNFQRFI